MQESNGELSETVLSLAIMVVNEEVLKTVRD